VFSGTLQIIRITGKGGTMYDYEINLREGNMARAMWGQKSFDAGTVQEFAYNSEFKGFRHITSDLTGFPLPMYADGMSTPYIVARHRESGQLASPGSVVSTDESQLRYVQNGGIVQIWGIITVRFTSNTHDYNPYVIEIAGLPRVVHAKFENAMDLVGRVILPPQLKNHLRVAPDPYGFYFGTRLITDTYLTAPGISDGNIDYSTLEVWSDIVDTENNPRYRREPLTVSPFFGNNATYTCLFEATYQTNLRRFS
jgi:hypothetical protein